MPHLQRSSPTIQIHRATRERERGPAQQQQQCHMLPAAQQLPPRACRYLSHFDPLVAALRWRAAGSPRIFDAAFVRGESISLQN